MDEGEKEIWKKTLLISSIILVPAAIIFLVLNPVKIKLGGHNTEKVRKKIKNHLYRKYGEEFIVDRIGTQTANGDTDYVARIYPKSIVGTKKEGDEYYYAKAGVDKKSFGRLGGVGDGYGTVKMNMEAERYLMPKIKKIFGKMVLSKVKVGYYKKNESGYFGHYLVHGFEEKLKKVKGDPKNKRLELELYIYIFDRIEDQAEKEKKRKNIFEFVQYLKKERLFEHLELKILFIDERVLAPSYDEYIDKVYSSDKVEKERYGETVNLPPMKLRRKMSKELQEEIDEMSEKELLKRMNRIKKSNLSDLRGYNTNYGIFIYSWGILKEKYPSSLDERDKSRNYSKLKHVQLGEGRKYIYTN